MKCKLFLFACVSCFVFSSCEDIIDPELERTAPVLTIDAWLVHRPGDQTIEITSSVAYDDNANYPAAVTDAIVVVVDDSGKEFRFEKDRSGNNGRYVWRPSAGELFGEIGRRYTLTVTINGEVFTATSYLAPVPDVDSVTFAYVQDDLVYADGYRAEFWAKDLVGPGNTYWIKTFKNGVLLNKPEEINVAYDAGISSSTANDGKTFLPPVRLAINPQDVDDNDEQLPAYEVGDSIYVEINSVTEAGYNFLSQVIANTDRQTGLPGLFSTPLSNVASNISSTREEGTQVVGFFNTAAVSGKGKRLRL